MGGSPLAGPDTICLPGPAGGGMEATSSSSRNGTNVALAGGSLKGTTRLTAPFRFRRAPRLRDNGPSPSLRTSGLFSFVLETRVPTSGYILPSAFSAAAPVGSTKICSRALGFGAEKTSKAGAALGRLGNEVVSARIVRRPRAGGPVGGGGEGAVGSGAASMRRWKSA